MNYKKGYRHDFFELWRLSKEYNAPFTEDKIDYGRPDIAISWIMIFILQKNAIFHWKMKIKKMNWTIENNKSGHDDYHAMLMFVYNVLGIFCSLNYIFRNIIRKPLFLL